MGSFCFVGVMGGMGIMRVMLGWKSRRLPSIITHLFDFTKVCTLFAAGRTVREGMPYFTNSPVQQKTNLREPDLPLLRPVFYG